MKQVTVLFLAMASAVAAISQPNGIAVHKHSAEDTPRVYLPVNTGTGTGSGEVFVNNINTRALREFTLSYPGASEIKWTILPEGFRVHFYHEGIQIRIFYTNNGNRISMLRYYDEDALPRGVRHLVKSSYYDYSIRIVTEVTTGETICYFIKIEDKNSMKTLKVFKDEMELVEEYSKS